MDSAPRESRKEALTRELAASRIALGDRVAILRHKLDVPTRAKASIRRHPLKWMGGSAAAGLLWSLWARHRCRQKKADRAARHSAIAVRKRTAGATLVSGLTSVAKAAVRAVVLEHVVKFVTPFVASKTRRG